MKINASVTTDKPIATDLPETGSRNNSYAVVRPAFYPAIVKQVEDKLYEDRAGQKYLAVTPEVVLLNDNNTIIGRQSYTVGALGKKGELISLKEGKSPVWSGENGALFFFVALGLAEGSGNTITLTDVDTEAISDRVVIVQTGIGAYIKGGRNWSARDVGEVMEARYGKDWVKTIYEGDFDYTPEDLIIAALAAAEGEDVAEIKLKNVIRGWYKVSKAEVESNGWYTPDGKQVFVNEVAYLAFAKGLEGSADGGW